MTVPELVEIDGTYGEGGGQIVRSSLALSALTGKPFLLDGVRAKRSKPGLQRQHLTAVRAAAAICNAEVDGAEPGSGWLEFYPQSVQPGSYKFDIGSAGSTTLVCQTVLPALMLAEGPSVLRLRGGTHNPLAPPSEFLDQAYLPWLRRMGVQADVRLHRHGFFPAGGGDLEVTIHPAQQLGRIHAIERGELVEQYVEAVVARLPVSIAQRQVATVAKNSGWKSLKQRACQVDSAGPGNAIFIRLTFENVTEVFTEFGQKGVPAERVAAACLRQAQTFIDQDVPIGEHLADQLLLPAAIAAHQFGVTSCFLTGPLSDHSVTHVECIRRFLDVEVDVRSEGPLENGVVRLEVRG